MAITIWGLLEKSQTDPEKIEEAIVRLITEHNANEAAHLGAGQSLQSHKAAEIIDHVVDSIVADKIKDSEVTVLKLSRDRILINPSLESSDGWYTLNQGAGGVINFYVAVLEILCGTTVNNKTICSIRLGAWLEENEDLDPFFECKAKFVDYGIADFKIKNRGSNPFDDSGDGFGFECLKDDTLMYGFYTHSGTKYRTSLSGIAPDGWHHYRAEMIPGTPAGKFTIKYYVDGVLKLTYSNITISFASDTCFTVGVQQQTALSEQGWAAITDIVFSSKWP